MRVYSVITRNFRSVWYSYAVMFLLFIIVVVVLVWVGHRVTSNESPPAYPGWLPVIGHLHQIAGYDQTKIWMYYKKLSEESIKKGGVMTFYLGLKALIFISNPDDAQIVTRHCMEKPYLYNFAKPWLGNSLLTADVPTWKSHRKLMNLAFTQQVLNGTMSVFNSQSRRLTKYFDQNEQMTFEPHTMLLMNNLETICITSFAIDPDTHKELFIEYVAAIKNLFALMFERFLKYWLHIDFIFYFSSLKTRQESAVKVLHNFSNTILQRRKTEITCNEQPATTDQFRPLMDKILELSMDKGLLTDRQVREELDGIIYGGHDTLANSLTYTLMLLGSDHERQEKVYKEIIEVLDPSDRDVEKEDLVKLVYLENVIKESLRLYPVLPVIPRVSHAELKIKNYTFPAGSMFLIDAWSLHRHPVWGPDAEDFRPERWENLKTLPKAFSAFGVGKRSCIGKSYAMMSMKITLVHLLRRYKVTSDISKLTLKMDSVLRPESGQIITIELRK